MTSPVSDSAIVLGKYLASMTLLVIMLAPTFFYSAYMFFHSEPAAPWRVLFTAYLGVFLLGGALLALGSFFSSLTESQIIASILTFGAALALMGAGLWAAGFGSRGFHHAVPFHLSARGRLHARRDRYFQSHFLREFYFLRVVSHRA